MDAQCGLCLSCGAPFMPGEDDAGYFNHPGNLSVLYLNGAFRRDPDMCRRYGTPKFSGPRQAAHIIHKSHHEPALKHMIYQHKRDDDVEMPDAGDLISTKDKPAFPFYTNPSAGQNPRVAAWAKPAKNDRIKFGSLIGLLKEIGKASHSDRGEFPLSLGVTYITCQGCNLVMTQKSNFERLLGCNMPASGNFQLPLVNPRSIRVCNVDTNGDSIAAAYDRWGRSNNGAETEHPSQSGDAIDPVLAYYLHMCLPYEAPNSHKGSFFSANNFGNCYGRVRELYIEMSWLVLQICCLLYNMNVGKNRSGEMHAHGAKEQLGPLDFYVSYFFWRLVQFEHLDTISSTHVDFIQWHQKYYCEAEFCPEIFSNAPVVLGNDFHSDCTVPARVLVEVVCKKLVDLYKEKIRRVGCFIVGKKPDTTDDIKDFFVPPGVIGEHKRVSMSGVSPNDFDGMLSKFGVTVLLSRVMHLCDDVPDELKRVLSDFRREWQWKEIASVRRRNKGVDALGAYSLYSLCNLRDAPDELPTNYLRLREVLAQPRCSPWRSVLALRRCKAFDTYEDIL